LRKTKTTSIFSQNKKILDKKIAFLGVDCKYYTANQRFAGYREAMLKSGLVPREEYEIHCSDFKIEMAKEGVNKLLNLPDPPTAIFATNFYMTVGMISVLNERNLKIGQDISVIGYDSLFVSDMVYPKLTLVEQPIEEAEKQIADIIIQRVVRKKEKGDSKTIMIPTVLIEGESIKKI